jgi:hypothetical protein
LTIESGTIIISNIPLHRVDDNNNSNIANALVPSQSTTTTVINTSPVGISGPTATLGQPFMLAVNHATSIKQTDLNIRFVDVTEDSRCPLDVKCIWAGQVSVLVEATRDSTGQSLGSFILTLMANGNDNKDSMNGNGSSGSDSGPLSSKTISEDGKSYLIQLNSVQPYPLNGQQKMPSKGYIATFTVT